MLIREIKSSSISRGVKWCSEMLYSLWKHSLVVLQKVKHTVTIWQSDSISNFRSTRKTHMKSCKWMFIT